MYAIAPFSRKSIVMGPFISLKAISMAFFADLCTELFLYLRVSVSLLLTLLYIQRSISKENLGGWGGTNIYIYIYIFEGHKVNFV